MEKTGLVLGGGGSRGSYQMGVWQALLELNVKIDIVTGTSVGALNAALVTTGQFEQGIALWKEINTSKVFNVTLDEDLSTDKKVKAMVKNFVNDYKKGGTDAYPLKKLLDQYVLEDDVRTSKVECGFVVADKKTLKPLNLYKEDIKAGQINDYLLASSSLYPAIKVCKIDGKDYIDGGYCDNIPVELALNKGAKKIIAVDLDAVGVTRYTIYKKVADLKIIKSYWDLGPILVFDNKTILRNIRLGYLDTMKAFGIFEGCAYTFSKGEIANFIKTQKSIIECQNAVCNVCFSHVKADENDKDLAKAKMLHATMTARIKVKYGMKQDVNYQVFMRSCMEAAGEIFGIDARIIFTWESFVEAILENVNKIEVPNIPKFNEKNGNLSKAFKETIKLLDKKVRTVYLACTIKNAVYLEQNLDILGLSMLVPDELLAGFFLALID